LIFFQFLLQLPNFLTLLSLLFSVVQSEAVEVAKARAREAEAIAEAEKAKMTLGLAQLKLRRGLLSTRNTSTIHTPAEVDSSSDSNSSTAAVVDGAPPKRSFTAAEVAKLREYALAFKSVLSVSGCTLMFYPSPRPTVVKLLSAALVTTEICPYTPEDVKNAYCALVLECDSEVDTFLKKHAAGELVKDYARDGVKTPNALIPR
jgi:hypothetical protein